MAMRLRPRNAWEAADLGIQLVRANARAIYTAWFLAYVPVAAIVFALLWDAPFKAWLAMWWLKPLFDILVLAVLARRLFGEPAPAIATVGSLPALAWRSGILGNLTWRRLDFARSLHLPVRQLEHLKGKAARSRARELDREARAPAVWLSFMFLMTELLFGLALSFLIALMTPVQAPMTTLIEGWFTSRFEQGMSGAILGAVAASLIEPFYVACGFTLYLQRRTMLEGWDIELRFRQMSERVAAARKAAAQVAACLLMGVIFCAAAPGVNAAEAPARAPRDEIREVLKDPVFGSEGKRTSFKYVGPTWEPKGKSNSKPWDWTWLEELSLLVGRAGRAALWIAAAAAAAFVLYHLAKYLRAHGFGTMRTQRPDFMFGLDVRPGSLPDDVAGTAESLARDSRIREALSLLYRGALVRFLDAGIEFTDGDTEGDCLRRVYEKENVARAAYFRKLVTSWQTLAYAHGAVQPAEVLALAQGWRRQFPSRGGEASLEPQPA
jgi:hypothetical protein